MNERQLRSMNLFSQFLLKLSVSLLQYDTPILMLPSNVYMIHKTGHAVLFWKDFKRYKSLRYVFHFGIIQKQNWTCFFIIFVSDGKPDNWTGVRKRTDWNLPCIEHLLFRYLGQLCSQNLKTCSPLKSLQQMIILFWCRMESVKSYEIKIKIKTEYYRKLYKSRSETMFWVIPRYYSLRRTFI